MILLDLFSGYGGFHKGLCDAGFAFEKVYYSEIDKHAIANYRYNYEEAKYIGAVEHVIESGIKRPDIIAFGSPCQDFSIAGRRNGLAGERSCLVKHALSTISYFRPDVYIWENVKGCFSSSSGADFWAIIQAFANIGGYRFQWQLLNTSWFLPQNRERIFLVGCLANKCCGQIFPIEENVQLYSTKNEANKRWTQAKNCTTIKQTFGNKADDTFIISYTRGKNGEVENYHKKDKANTVKGHIGNTSQYIITEPNGKHGGKERNYTDIAPSITQRYGTGGDNIPYVNNIRRMTEIECERLQGLPDDWTKYGNYDGTIREISSTQRYKMLGNGVTVKVVEEIGKSILKHTQLTK